MFNPAEGDGELGLEEEAIGSGEELPLALPLMPLLLLLLLIEN